MPDKRGDEMAPNSNAERYNYDRMSMLLREIDFRNRTILDIGCNAGWFSFEIALQGARYVAGVDYDKHPEMGGSLAFAHKRARAHNMKVEYFNYRLTGDNIETFFRKSKIKKFDYILLMSTLHHILEPAKFMKQIAEHCEIGLIYEHHEFWNDLFDHDNKRIDLIGTGHRFGWNEDNSWLRKMNSLESHSVQVLDYFRNSEWFNTLSLDSYSEIKFLGFSEKRRPLLLLIN